MVNKVMKGNRLSNLILGTFIPVFLTVILFFIGYHSIAVPFIEKRLLETKKEMIKELTNSVWNLVSDYEKRVESGELSLEEAQARAAARIRTIRYGREGKDYFWINDKKPVMIMHPYTTRLEGMNLTDYTDPAGKHLFTEFVDTVNNSGAGYVKYMWQWKDDSTLIVPKISYVRGFDDWNWIIGTGIYVEDVNEWIRDITRNLNKVFSAILVLVTLIGVYMVIRMFRIEKERNKAVIELLHLQLLLGDIINSMPSILIGINKGLLVTQWNHEAETLTGKSFKQAKGNRLVEVFPQMKDFLDRIGVSISTREKLLIERVKWNVNGEINCFDIVVYPLQSKEHEGAVLKIDNVDEKVKFEEMMIETEKMLSIGGLAAGMAHEINNPLAGILQNIQVIKNRLEQRLPSNLETTEALGFDFEKLTEYMEKRNIFNMIDDIILSGKRAAVIVDNMLSFSRNTESGFEYRNVAEILDESVILAESEYDLVNKTDFKNIIITKKYEENLPEVYCDSGKIKQVFYSILKNSAESINKRQGTFEPEIRITVRKEENWVRTEIYDNGIGMDESTRKRVFEPFFTTKKVGAGTGLGLSISFFIIKENHEGTLMVESSENRGANFIIRLPIDKRTSHE